MFSHIYKEDSYSCTSDLYIEVKHSIYAYCTNTATANTRVITDLKGPSVVLVTVNIMGGHIRMPGQIK